MRRTTDTTRRIGCKACAALALAEQSRMNGGNSANPDGLAMAATLAGAALAAALDRCRRSNRIRAMNFNECIFFTPP